MPDAPKTLVRTLWIACPAVIVVTAVLILAFPGSRTAQPSNPENIHALPGESPGGQPSSETDRQARANINELESFKGPADEFASKAESAYRLVNKEERAAILGLCEKRLGDELLPFLKKVQNTETDSDLRFRIMQIISGGLAEKSDEVLISNLGHFDTQLALASLKALRNRKPPEAVPGLVKYLDRSDAKERWIAVDVLAEIGGDKALAAIEKCATSSNVDKQTRLRAITALGKLKAKNSLASLERNLSDEDEQIRLVTREVIQVLKQN